MKGEPFGRNESAQDVAIVLPGHQLARGAKATTLILLLSCSGGRTPPSLLPRQLRRSLTIVEAHELQSALRASSERLGSGPSAQDPKQFGKITSRIEVRSARIEQPPVLPLVEL
jgi:hypothetical protein